MSKPDITTVGGATFEPGYAGQIADGAPIQKMDYVNTGSSAIDFGIAVVRDTADGSCKVIAADTDQILGISMRVPTMVADSTGAVKYLQYATVAVLKSGLIYCVAGEDVRRGDQALILTAGGGTIGGSKGGVAGSGRVAFPGMNAVWEDTVLSGKAGRVRIITTGTARTTT